MIPLFLSNPESMVKVRVVTVKDDSEKTLKTLHKIGALHIEESKELRPIDRAAIEQERDEVSELLTFVNNVLVHIPQKERISLDEDIEVIYTRPFSEISGEVRTLYNKVNKLYERIVKLDDEVRQLTELKGYLEPLAGQTDLGLRDLKFNGAYLFSRVFVVSSETYETLHEKLESYLFENAVTAVGGETVVHAVAKVKDRETIESLIADAGGRILEIPDEGLTLKEFLETTGSKISGLEEEITKLREELQEKSREDLNRLALLHEALAAESERLSVLEKATEARYVTLVEGWIPESDAETALTEVRENIEYVFIDTREPEKDEAPPTKQKNVKGLRPFQTIVNLFALPKYGEKDPTPIVAYSFALFFGIMVCDVLYALGIILLGKFLLSKFVDDPKSEAFKRFQNLIYICGGVALIGGVLTGQYLGDIYAIFGFEDFPLVLGVKNLLQDPVSFIVLALGIGFIHVNIGHIIAFVNGIKERNKGLILSKVGLFLVEIGIPAILNSLLGVNLPGFTPQIYSILLYCMAGGIVLIAVSSVMQSGGLGAILWLFDLTGLLGDIMSYARLAGVGLATFYLASTFNMMAGLFGEIIPGPVGVVIGGIMGVVIVVFGHMINMVLTAITGFMHSLRLCFVEFLFKFYEGGGKEYSPFKLRKRATVSIATKS